MAGSELRERAFIVKRRWGDKCLFPSDPFAYEFMAPLKEGAEILVSTRKPRSVKQHRFLFALLRKVIENHNGWADEEALLLDLKCATGLYEPRVNRFDGTLYHVPSSISFASMPAERFKEWLDKAIMILARDVLHIAPEALREEVEAVVNPGGGLAQV